MRHPRVVVYETDGRLAATLREVCQARGWALREPRRLRTCLGLFQAGGPAVLVLKLGTDLVREFTLLDRLRWLSPTALAVVVSDTDQPAVTALAWDLGAHFVLAPPLPRHLLPDVVERLMASEMPHAP